MWFRKWQEPGVMDEYKEKLFFRTHQKDSCQHMHKIYVTPSQIRYLLCIKKKILFTQTVFCWLVGSD